MRHSDLNKPFSPQCQGVFFSVLHSLVFLLETESSLSLIPVFRISMECQGYPGLGASSQQPMERYFLSKCRNSRHSGARRNGKVWTLNLIEILNVLLKNNKYVYPPPMPTPTRSSPLFGREINPSVLRSAGLLGEWTLKSILD